MEKLNYAVLKQSGYTGYILEKAPEKVSISDRLADGRLQTDRAAGNEAEQPERKQNIEH